MNLLTALLSLLPTFARPNTTREGLTSTSPSAAKQLDLDKYEFIRITRLTLEDLQDDCDILLDSFFGFGVYSSMRVERKGFSVVLYRLIREGNRSAEGFLLN